jgi:hypothetical protein
MENWFFKRPKKWRDRRAEVARGLDCYDMESRVFPLIAKRIQKGGDLTKRVSGELLRGTDFYR